MKILLEVDKKSYKKVINDLSKEENVKILEKFDSSEFINKRFMKILKYGDKQSKTLLVTNEQLEEQKKEIENSHRLLTEILNSMQHMMFVTNLKKVMFSNKIFNEFFNVSNIEEFNTLTNNDLLKIFIQTNNYLNAKQLQKGETFYDLINRTLRSERIVCILDSFVNPKAFAIDITRVTYCKHNVDNINYLVTLTDITQLKEKEMFISNKAYIDGLTKVYNRNKFDEIIEKYLDSKDINKDKLCIAIVDIDHFKSFNDTYGHLVGDEVLIMLAQNINNNIREMDTFARWGGEEFVILFTQTTVDNAKIICDKLRVKISQLKHSTAGGITASFGVTNYRANDTLESMFKRCDDALYEAKKNGRNMVCTI